MIYLLFLAEADSCTCGLEGEKHEWEKRLKHVTTAKTKADASTLQPFFMIPWERRDCERGAEEEEKEEEKQSDVKGDLKKMSCFSSAFVVGAKEKEGRKKATF